MRHGTNPFKKKPQLEPYKRHRIILPIHIGANHEYFAQTLDTLRLCLRSLIATIDLEHVSISIINNNSIPEVEVALRPYIATGQIDRYILNNTNRGKPDAVAGEILATYEPFVTLADCDVLFYHGWMRALEQIYSDYRGVGAVSPFPAPNHQFYQCGTTWLAAILSGRVRRGKFVRDADLDEFSRSIGKEASFFSPPVRKWQYVMRASATPALLGCGHFVVMFRRHVFNRMVYTPKLAGASNGEQDIDAMSDKAGFLRLSTPDYHVYHLGNVVEDWMEPKVKEIEHDSRVALLDDSTFDRVRTANKPIAGYAPKSLRWLILKAAQILTHFMR